MSYIATVNTSAATSPSRFLWLPHIQHNMISPYMWELRVGHKWDSHSKVPLMLCADTLQICVGFEGNVTELFICLVWLVTSNPPMLASLVVAAVRAVSTYFVLLHIFCSSSQYAAAAHRWVKEQYPQWLVAQAAANRLLGVILAADLLHRLATSSETVHISVH